MRNEPNGSLYSWGMSVKPTPRPLQNRSAWRLTNWMSSWVIAAQKPGPPSLEPSSIGGWNVTRRPAAQHGEGPVALAGMGWLPERGRRDVDAAIGGVGGRSFGHGSVLRSSSAEPSVDVLPALEGIGVVVPVLEHRVADDVVGPVAEAVERACRAARPRSR